MESDMREGKNHRTKKNGLKPMRLVISVLIFSAVLFSLVGCGRKNPVSNADAEAEAEINALVSNLHEEISAVGDIESIDVDVSNTTVDYDALPEDESINSLEQPTELSDDLYSYQVSIDGDVIQLPIQYSDLANLGYELDISDESDLQLPSMSSDNFLSVKKGDIKLGVCIYNPDVKTHSYEDCLVGEITISRFDLNGHKVIFPGGLTNENISMESIIDLYGEPTSRYESSEYQKLTYEQDLYCEYEFTFYENAFFDARIENTIIPRGYKPSEVNTEVPESVSLYRKPKDVSDEIFDFNICFDGEYYQLPFPVSELLDKGWEIKDKESYSYVGSRGTGLMTLTRGDDMISSVQFMNYSDDSTMIENCFVTLIRISKYNDAPLTVGNNITIGDDRTEVVKKLEKYKSGAYEYEEYSNPFSICIRDTDNFYRKITLSFGEENKLDSIEIGNKLSLEEYMDSHSAE